MCFGDEVADLMCLYVVRISRVDTQLGPAVRLTAVDRQQHDTELLVAHPAHTGVTASTLANLPRHRHSPGRSSEATLQTGFKKIYIVHRHRHRGAKYCDDHICMSVRSHISKTVHVQTSVNFLYMWPWLDSCVMTMQYVMYFRFVDDVIFAYNWSRKGDATRAYIQNDSPGQQRSLMSTIALLRFV